MRGYTDFLESKKQLEQLIAVYEREAEEEHALRREIGNFSKFREQLLEKYGGKFENVEKAAVRRYSRAELEELREELADTSFLTIIKRFLGIGKKAEESYAELVGKLNGLLAFLEEQFKKAGSRVSQAQKELKSAAVAYERDYEHILKVSGSIPAADWGRFCQADHIVGDLYLGSIELELETELQFSLPHLQTFMPNAYSDCMLRAPYTHILTHPLHLLYEFKKDSGIKAIQSVRALIYQMLRMTPEYFFQLHLIDAKNTGADFAELIELQKVRRSNVISLNRKVTKSNFRLAQTYFNDRDISEGIQALDEYMTTVADEMGQYTSLSDYNEVNGGADGRGSIPYQVVIIENFPMGFSEENIRRLDKLIQNGRMRGISILLLNNLDVWDEVNSRGYRTASSLQSKISREALLAVDSIRLLQNEANLMASDCSGFLRMQLMLEGHANYIEDVVSQKTEVKEVDNYFPHVIDTELPYGRMDSMKGLHIPFAIDNRGTILEYRLGEAMNAHGLICGGTGSGKSTLLHMLISSVVMNYSPEDVEIWLADYKITEFYSYKTNTPPHIRFIGLSKTVDFSYAFLDKITREMNHRQDVIAEADFQYKLGGGKSNITNFNDYREKFGIASMRRLLVIIDEFHVMSQHAQLEPEYKEKLENLLSEARALGIIMVFSDQAIVDGLRGLSDKGKKQIKARLALANYADELKETLNETDREKIRPFLNMKVGEVAMQTVHEDKDEDGASIEVTTIERAKTIYIDGEWRYTINAEARRIYDIGTYTADCFDDREVDVMSMNAIDAFEKDALPVRRDGSRDFQIYLGKPLDLQFSMNFPLQPRKGNNIMCVSGNEEQQMRILRAVLMSFARAKDYEILIMTDPYVGIYREFGEELKCIAAGNLHVSVYEDMEEICYQINRIMGIMKNRGNQKKILVVWLGLDNMADMLREESTAKSSVLRELSGAENADVSGTSAQIYSDALMLQQKLEADFDRLFEDIDAEDENPYAENVEVREQGYLYNACEDIVRLIHMGPTRNIYHMVIYDTAAALRDFREVKVSDFNHRIAFSMSESEAGDFLERSALIRGLPEELAFYYNGRSGKKFIPYKL